MLYKENAVKVSRNAVIDTYREMTSWVNNRHGVAARMMLKVPTGEVWADLFMDEGDDKIYVDEDVIPVPVQDIVWSATDSHPLAEEEIIHAICAWCQRELDGKEADPDA